jgi:DNA-binding CsgD family transcriptional regulator
MALLDPLYEAATRPEMWEVFLRKAAEFLRADTTAIIVLDPENDQTAVRVELGYTEEMRHDTEQMMRLNPWIPEIQKYQPIGWYSGGVEDVISMPAYRSSAFYKDFCCRHNFEWTAAAVVFSPEGLMPSLVVSRSEIESPFSAGDKELLKQLAPHLGRVFEIDRTMAALREGNAAGQYALDLIGGACITLDGCGRVLRLNRRAEVLIAGVGTLRVKDRRLLAATTAEQNVLNACVVPVCANGAERSQDAGVGAAVLHSAQGKPLYLSVLPYHSNGELLDGRPAALVFITTQEEPGQGEHRLWHAMFGLSPAECRVAEMMKQGMEVTEISEAIKIKVDTVRYYQKSVYRKTSVRGQGQLMRLLTRLPSSNP